MFQVSTCVLKVMKITNLKSRIRQMSYLSIFQCFPGENIFLSQYLLPFVRLYNNNSNNNNINNNNNRNNNNNINNNNNNNKIRVCTSSSLKTVRFGRNKMVFKQ